jgi:glycosyltransferase involved in cell wall biosynthesis
MATGLPVVTSNVGGTAEIVRHGENGYLIRPGDARDLGCALSTVLSDSRARYAMGMRSRQLAELKFDVRRNARRTIGLLHDIAGEGAASSVASPQRCCREVGTELPPPVSRKG